MTTSKNKCKCSNDLFRIFSIFEIELRPSKFDLCLDQDQVSSSAQHLECRNYAASIAHVNLFMALCT